MLPLHDLINHREAKNPNKSDLVTFDLKPVQHKGKPHIGFWAQGSCPQGSEFTYSYSDMMNPMYFAFNYGYVPHGVSAHAVVSTGITNLFPQFNRLQREYCKGRCLDPSMYSQDA